MLACYSVAIQLNVKLVNVPAVLNVFTMKLVAVIVLTVIKPAVEPVIVAVTVGGTEKYAVAAKVIVSVPELVVPLPYKVRRGA